MSNSKWVACWGNATSITNRREAVYAKELTLRYPVRMCFSGTMLRFRFSNLTGTEPVSIAKAFVGHTPITFGGQVGVTLMPGKETESDAIGYAVNRGDHLHPSERAYEAMAQAAAHKLIRYMPRYDHEENF